MSEFDCGWVQDESDETLVEQEIFEIVRNSYTESNQDYLKAQVKVALKEPILSKQETLNGLIDWIVNAGCTGMNDYYRKFVFSAIGHLLK